MTMIKDTASLAALCEALASERFVTVDTEFLRDSTYWPRLCLVQVAGSNGPYAIDPLANGLSLDPLFDLFANPAVIKVFHAARQDVEIFYHLTGKIPAPLFDTQIAAMVCGFGDQVGYEQLVRAIANKKLDKSSRFTDWARRPLSDRQLTYALADVTHLRVIFEDLETRLAKSERTEWVVEEKATLTDPATYDLDPEASWRRIKMRSNDPAFRTRVQALAAWRERR
ncbi:MAG: ribonuclease D, partial [Pseudomonadota bacterium]